MNAKKLGFGLMRLPTNTPGDRADIDMDQLCRMVDTFIGRGFTYFDTAWMYCGFASEPAARAAIVDRYPRESFTLATKLHYSYINTPSDRDAIFFSQLEKTGAGFFDYYLLHDIGGSGYNVYERLDCFDWIMRKKEQGLVRKIGFSFHDTPQLLDHVLTKYPFMDFVQLQINYLDWDHLAIQSRLCYETAVRHGKPVVVMEPCKGGTLAQVPPQVEEHFRAYAPGMSIPSWALRFAASLDNVMMVLSGMSTLAQVEDNTSYMQDFRPLTEQERRLCLDAAALINSTIAIPCTGCSYCTDGCPMDIAIPQYFALYNNDLKEIKHGHTTSQRNYYNRISTVHGKASDCIQCGQCESICPQHLHIIDELKTVAERFE